MKRLILASLLAGSATGCILTTDGYSEEVGFIDTSWSFHTADGTPLSCPAGFTTAEVTAVSRTYGDAFIDLYDCDALGGSAAYPVDEYDVTIAITNTSGSSEYAHGLTQTLDIFRTDATIGEDFIHDGGRIIFDWVLVDADTNRPLECVTAGNPKEIKVDVASGETAISTSLACGDGFGISNPLPAGAYTATIAAVNQAGQPLGEPVSEPVAVRDRNDYDDLGTITLPIGNFVPDPEPPAPE